MFEISVFGANIADLESVGGWQMVWRGNCLAHAEVALMGLIASYGVDNVDWNWQSTLKKMKKVVDKRST